MAHLVSRKHRNFVVLPTNFGEFLAEIAADSRELLIQFVDLLAMLGFFLCHGPKVKKNKVFQQSRGMAWVKKLLTT